MPRLAALCAFAALASTYFVGVIFFFAPVAEADNPSGPLIPMGLAFIISIALYIALFVWVTEQMGHALKAGLTIALAQFLLVNVDNVLTGKRGLATAAASTVLLFVSWTVVGLVYERLRKPRDA